jgi:DNA-3-methyladenine glycosylase II
MDHVVHLSKDKKLKKLLEAQKPFALARQKNVYLDLCSSIMSQQLST